MKHGDPGALAEINRLRAAIPAGASVDSLATAAAESGALGAHLAATYATPAQVAAGYAPKKVVALAEAFNQPLLTSGNSAVNPTSVVGFDPVTDLVFGADRTTNNLSVSANYGAAWTHSRGIPTGMVHQQVHKIVRFGASVYLFGIDPLDGRAGVFASIARTSTSQSFSWSATRRVAMSASTSASGTYSEVMNGKSTAFAAGSSAMMLGDYGDFAAGPKIQRSLNGTTWTTVWGPDPTVRHVHCVAEDPYNAGHWYATLGDADTPACVIRSTNNGDTWSTVIAAAAGNPFQAVQISFSPTAVFLASDHYGGSVFYFDRTEAVIRHYCLGSHANLPVPGAIGGRIITDLATTSGSTAITSASLTAADKGRIVRADAIPAFGTSNAAGPNFLSDAGAGTGTLARAATATGTGQTAVIEGDRIYSAAYMGLVDPATGIYYGATTDGAGNTHAIFAVPHAGAAPVLLSAIPGATVPPTVWRITAEMFLHDGWIYCSGRRFKAFA